MLKKIIIILGVFIGILITIYGCAYYYYLCGNLIIEGKAITLDEEALEGVEVKVRYEAYRTYFYTSRTSIKQTTNKDGKYTINIDGRVKWFIIFFDTKTKDNATVYYESRKINRSNYTIDYYFNEESKSQMITNKSDQTYTGLRY